METELKMLIAERSKLKQQLEDVEAEIELIIDIHDNLHKVVQQYKKDNMIQTKETNVCKSINYMEHNYSKE
jgi:hypothetical protein